VIPTLTAGAKLVACVQSLERQTLKEFEVVIVDNSGSGMVRASEAAGSVNSIIENQVNVGFGTAINQGYTASRAPFLATLNDDAVAQPGWLEYLLAEADAQSDSGMFASHVELAGAGKLDSAGMVICHDGTSKQRGQAQPPESMKEAREALFPSGSAALYRRAMLDDIGGFDDDFFLYCEDTDLGLRARWAGWTCRYVPGAVVEHDYSRSAGRASPLKAYFVERNRLYVLAKNFPMRMLWRAPFSALARYFWHAVSILRGRGTAAEFQREGHSPLRLPWYVVRAHFALLRSMPRLLRQRRAIRRTARLSAAEFHALLLTHSISAREVASL
jgi:GT2 family glycosyltransferase